MKITVIVLSLLICSACMSNSPKNEWENPKNAWENPKTYQESVLAIGDSVAAPEQLELRKALQDIIFEKVTIVDNKLVLDADEAYFKSKKIAPIYCEFMQKSLQETNEGIVRMEKENGMPIDVKQTFESSKREHIERKEQAKSEGTVN